MPAKLKHEFVFNEYAKRGYTLLDLYKNSDHKSKVMCPKGCVTEMRYNNFKYGADCLLCSGVAPYTHEFIFNEYAKEGYVLDSIYKRNKHKDDLICPRGHKIKMKYNNFQQGDRCRDCKYEDMSGENHYRFNHDRTRKRRTDYLRFDLRRIKILKDDPNYDTYKSAKIKSKLESKLNNNPHVKCSMTVDHIFPRTAFIDNDLDLIHDSKIIQKICNLRENLRILPREENGSKGGKYDQEEFMKWFSEIIKKY